MTQPQEILAQLGADREARSADFQRRRDERDAHRDAIHAAQQVETVPVSRTAAANAKRSRVAEEKKATWLTERNWLVFTPEQAPEIRRELGWT